MTEPDDAVSPDVPEAADVSARDAAGGVQDEATAPAPVRLSDLSVDYRPRRDSPRLAALVGVDLELPAGTVTAVVGESGSGKSTLAAVLGSLRPEAPTSIVGGDATVLGTSLRRASAKALDRLRLRVGYVAQDAGGRLTPQLTVTENVGEPILLRDKDWDRDDLELRVATLLDRVRLPLSLLDKLPHELSSGMRQRVALARSLVLEPEVWIADEPGRGVDITLGELIPELIEQERTLRPFTVLMVGHDLAFRPIVDQVAVLSQGALVALAEPERVLDDPLHPFLIALAEQHEEALRAGAIGHPAG